MNPLNDSMTFPSWLHTDPLSFVFPRAVITGGSESPLSAVTALSFMLSSVAVFSGKASLMAGSPSSTYRSLLESAPILFFERRSISPIGRILPSLSVSNNSLPRAEVSMPLREIYTVLGAEIPPINPPASERVRYSIPQCSSSSHWANVQVAP